MEWKVIKSGRRWCKVIGICVESLAQIEGGGVEGSVLLVGGEICSERWWKMVGGR